VTDFRKEWEKFKVRAARKAQECFAPTSLGKQRCQSEGKHTAIIPAPTSTPPALALPAAPAAPRRENIVVSVIAFLRRFVFLRDEALYLLVAVWIIGTYLHQDFDFAGYLFAYSPEPQSGKTTLLDVLHLLVANSSGVQIAPTQAMLFRTAGGKTQLLDEIDTWGNEDDLRSVLNAGFQKGAKVTRIDKDRQSGFAPQEFSVYGPKALAGIGLNKLARATRDRTFAISMVRQMRSEKRERLRLRLVNAEADSLKKKIAEWVTARRQEVVGIYHEANFPYLEQFGDRTMDIVDPLAAIVEAAFEGKPLVVARAKLVEAVRVTRNEQHSLTGDHRILRHLLSLPENEDPLVGTASELAKMCGNLAEPPNEYTIGRVLSNYGFRSQSHRKPGEDPKYRYVLRRRELQEVVDRWAGEPAAGAEDAPNTAATGVVGVVGSQGEESGQNLADTS
jgi:Protein of unknown function (DUF3631)